VLTVTSMRVIISVIHLVGREFQASSVCDAGSHGFVMGAE